jgi:hypothetical protein
VIVAREGVPNSRGEAFRGDSCVGIQDDLIEGEGIVPLQVPGGAHKPGKILRIIGIGEEGDRVRQFGGVEAYPVELFGLSGIDEGPEAARFYAQVRGGRGSPFDVKAFLEGGDGVGKVIARDPVRAGNPVGGAFHAGHAPLVRPLPHFCAGQEGERVEFGILAEAMHAKEVEGLDDLFVAVEGKAENKPRLHGDAVLSHRLGAALEGGTVPSTAHGVEGLGVHRL